MQRLSVRLSLVWPLLVLAAIAAIGCRSGGDGAPESQPGDDGHAAALGRLPGSFEQWLEGTDLVVAGEVIGFRSQNEEGPYSAPSAPDGSEATAPALPFAYYEVRVNEVVWTNQAPPAGESITLRLYGIHELNEFIEDVERPEEGMRRLFFLGQNPDGTYGISGSFDMVDATGEIATFGLARSSIETITGFATSVELLDALRRE